MDRARIPDDVIRFIHLSVPSVPYLEAMLLLRNENQQPWDGKLVARRLYMTEKAAHFLLAELHAAGILIVEDHDSASYRYCPETETLGAMIDRLALIYSKNLVDITNLIHSKNNKKAQQFAEAFVWRKDS